MSRIVLASLALVMLAGCGIKGDLERPGPMWGEERARQEERQRQEEANRRAQEAVTPEGPQASPAQPPPVTPPPAPPPPAN